MKFYPDAITNRPDQQGSLRPFCRCMCICGARIWPADERCARVILDRTASCFRTQAYCRPGAILEYGKFLGFRVDMIPSWEMEPKPKIVLWRVISCPANTGHQLPGHRRLIKRAARLFPVGWMNLLCVLVV